MKAFLCIFLILACPAILVAQPTLDQEFTDLLDRIQNQYANAADYSADFVQISEMTTLGGREESRGKMYFRKPNMMHWDYSTPEKKRLIADGSYIWIYHPDDKQAIKSPFSQMMTSRTPIALMAGTANLTEEFTIGLKEKYEQTGQVVLYLLPKIKDPQVAEILLTLDPKTLSISSTRVTDAYGNKTIINFSQGKFNSGVDKSIFSFSPPEGTEIISAP